MIELYEDLENKYDDFVNKMTANYELLAAKIIPEAYPDEVEEFSPNLCLMAKAQLTRDDFISKGAFPLIANEWLKPLSEYIGTGKCLEIMAGSGMLTFGLRKLGVNIIATDKQPWKRFANWTDIEKIDGISAIRKYAKGMDYVIMSWPEMGDTANLILQELRAINPSVKLIYIGEPGGCCADTTFIRNLQIVDREITRKINKHFHSFAGIHDLVMIGK